MAEILSQQPEANSQQPEANSQKPTANSHTEGWMADYRKLEVWARAHRLTLDVYEATRVFPKEEVYGLTSQLRRSAASMPANIAEGCGRRSDAELARFMGIALGSATELDYHLLLARDLAYLQGSTYDQLAAETQGVSRMLVAFIETLRRTNHQKPTANSQQPIARSQ